MSNIIKFPVIAGVDITTDEEGRYSLKALMQAAIDGGVTKDVRPNEWMALQSTQEMAEILITENPALEPIVSKPGRYGGTFVHELLAISYAGWISPAFQIKVNQTFIDYHTGSRQPMIPQDLPEALRLAADLAEQNKQLKPKAEALDRIACSEGSLCIRDAAASLQVSQTELFRWLEEHKWIHQRPGKAGWIAYSARRTSGHLVHKIHTIHKPDGAEKITEQVRVTPKGLARLAEIFSDQQAA